MHRLILILLAGLLLQSCSNPRPMFDGKYVKGIIIAKAVEDDYGFFLMSNDHDYAYMAMYKGDEFETEYLHTPQAFKVSEIDGIPIAHDFKEISDVSDMDKYPDDPITKIRYHGFTQNDHLDYLHKKIHLGVGAEYNSVLGGQYSVVVGLESESGNPSGTQTLIVDEAEKNEMIFHGPGVLFVQLDSVNVNEVTDVDICHYHGTLKIECRN